MYGHSSTFSDRALIVFFLQIERVTVALLLFLVLHLRPHPFAHQVCFFYLGYRIYPSRLHLALLSLCSMLTSVSGSILEGFVWYFRYNRIDLSYNVRSRRHTSP
ncbi:BTE_collapsed_G0044450.mRNA.1.CDS.1 [Saccharomyces cerevisiae]|nr:BTE_collapsed_G0044450.mRNA.1.CDS.1 [Saccharomyces cerevisiae]